MPHAFDLLVIGDANPDVVIGPLDTPLAFGQREQLVPSGTLTVGAPARSSPAVPHGSACASRSFTGWATTTLKAVTCATVSTPTASTPRR